MYNALAAVFNALSDSRTPLVLLIFSSLLNIFLDLHFITKLNMGIAGAAWATLISQGVSAVISFTVLVLRVKKIKSEPFRYFSAPLLPVMGRIAVPSILQQSIVSVGSLMVQSVINSFGTLVLAGYTAATKIHFVLIVPVLALGNACATFTAQNIGAGKPERVRSGYIAGIKITAVIYSAVLVCVILFADSILGIFLKDPVAAKTIETGRGYLHFIAPFYYIFGLKALTDGVLKGSGDVTVFTLSNLVNLTIRVLAAFALSPFIGARAVWYAIPAGWCVNFIIGGLRYRSGKWKEKKVIH